jgi:hypothetical protein
MWPETIHTNSSFNNMTQLPRLSPKSLQALKLIAGGQSYSVIVDSNPEINYHDIFFAAEEAVWIDERMANHGPEADSEELPPGPSAMESAKQVYPNAYAPWSANDDAELTTMHATGATTNEIAARYQRQPSAIRSRLAKLELMRS